MTKEEFLVDTINHFNCNNRSVGDDQCLYTQSNGKACAIGRFLLGPVNASINYRKYSALRYSDDLKLIPQWLMDMGERFPMAVQELHDCADYWDEEGLNSEGFAVAGGICDRFGLDRIILKSCPRFNITGECSK